MDKTIYCNLLTFDEVTKFEKLLIKMGIVSEFSRPAHYAKRAPYWFRTGKPYDEEKDDPLATIFVIVDDKHCLVDSGFRAVTGDTKVDTETMEFILTALKNYKSPTNPAKGS